MLLGRPIHWKCLVAMTCTARHNLTIYWHCIQYCTVSLYHSSVAANWNGIIINHFASMASHIQSVLCVHVLYMLALVFILYVSVALVYIRIYTRSTCHYCELSCVFTSSYKCDSSSECGSIKHSVGPHSVASDWRELQQIALWVIHLWHKCKSSMQLLHKNILVILMWG